MCLYMCKNDPLSIATELGAGDKRLRQTIQSQVCSLVRAVLITNKNDVTGREKSFSEEKFRHLRL